MVKYPTSSIEPLYEEKTICVGAMLCNANVIADDLRNFSTSGFSGHEKLERIVFTLFSPIWCIISRKDIIA